MRKLIPLVVLGLFIGATYLILNTQPDVQKRKKLPTPVISVETQLISPQDYQIVVHSFGRIRPRTQSQLIAQVSGQIIEVNPSFREGGFFDKGDVLVSIDPRDYRIQVEISAAELADARVAYEEALALADQAKKDRATLRTKGRVSNFALYKTQLAAAKTKVDAAHAKLKLSKLAVERADVKAPFAGRVLAKNVDVGEVVSSNVALASVYATDLMEIRLPLKNSDLGFLDLPENTPSENQSRDLLPDVSIVNSLGGTKQIWPAKLVRTAGAIDEQSQQLYVTAQIADPYRNRDESRRQLKIGQYITAKIQGKILNSALIIPSSTIYQGSYIYLYDAGFLIRRDVVVAWQNDKVTLIREGVEAGDELVLTPLGQVSSGTPVKRTQDEQSSAKVSGKPAGITKS